MQGTLEPREPPLAQTPSSKLAPAPDEESPLGLSMVAFAALALIAICTARALAPALPGSATGIAFLIGSTSFVAACTSQLVAAGGIALCLRLLGNVLILPGLGVAFRVLILPVTLAVVALVIGAAAQSLNPNLGRVLSILGLLAPAAAAALLLARGRTRAVGIVLLFTAAAAGFDVGAYESLRRAGSTTPDAGRTAALVALAFDATAAVLAFVWAARERRRVALGLALVLSALSIALAVGDAAASQTAPAWQIVLHRSLENLARRPVRAAASSLVDVAALLPIVVAGALLLVRGRNPDLRAALALCLLGRTSTGAPAAALLSIGATLLAVPHALQEKPEQARPNTST